MLKAEIVSYSGSKPILSINRYRAKVRDIESGDYEYEYAGRTGFDVDVINWLVFEKVFEQAVLALNELDA